ncbi:hypothetical protein L1987_12358 [Smallanthus sonchifolius]|uniref:Uncharacterized protein n=1 Tax=Smallanthus sonchifolius TaxID=185202 RepID=A0ACB9JF28_9ASTR|nr:hypothetical protein L1987_12358 [Smallanthus sonchifolius]
MKKSRFDGSDDVNEEFRRRKRRHALLLRFHYLGLSSGRHNWILNWAVATRRSIDHIQSTMTGRHELTADDPEYEEGRRHKSMAMAFVVDHGSGV